MVKHRLWWWLCLWFNPLSSAAQYCSLCRKVLLVLVLVFAPAVLLGCVHKQAPIVLVDLFAMSVTCPVAVKAVSWPASEVPSLWPSTWNMIKFCCAGVEMFKKSLSEGQAGDNVGLLLRGIQRDDVVRGQVVCKPGSVTPHKKFKGEIYALTKEEGGRHTPFFTNYKPQFFFRTADITGKDACVQVYYFLVQSQIGQ